MNDNEAVKYPRTPHLPNSEGMTSDDKKVSKTGLKNIMSSSDLVVTEKMDGGNVTMTRNLFFARSINSGTHLWDTPVKALWASLRHDIPEGWRVSGESLYARRSVAYGHLPGVFMVFGIWNEENELLSWDETVEWAEILGLPMVPVLYRGSRFEDAVTVWHKTMNSDTSEGFVIRTAGAIPHAEFANNFAKYVRANHVRTNAGWRRRDDFELNVIAGK